MYTEVLSHWLLRRAVRQKYTEVSGEKHSLYCWGRRANQPSTKHNSHCDVAISSSETYMNQSTLGHVAEDSTLHSHHYGNLKYHMKLCASVYVRVMYTGILKNKKCTSQNYTVR